MSAPLPHRKFLTSFANDHAAGPRDLRCVHVGHSIADLTAIAENAAAGF
jgi:hypothetical protein